MSYLDYYIYLIYVIKILYITIVITSIYLKLTKKQNTELYKNTLFWKEKFEFIFTFTIAILLLFLFNPRQQKVIINKDIQFLLYLFGFVLIITADWNTFMHESKLFVFIQQIFGLNK